MSLSDLTCLPKSGIFSGKNGHFWKFSKNDIFAGIWNYKKIKTCRHISSSRYVHFRGLLIRWSRFGRIFRIQHLDRFWKIRKCQENRGILSFHVIFWFLQKLTFPRLFGVLKKYNKYLNASDRRDTFISGAVRVDRAESGDPLFQCPKQTSDFRKYHIKSLIILVLHKHSYQKIPLSLLTLPVEICQLTTQEMNVSRRSDASRYFIWFF